MNITCHQQMSGCLTSTTMKRARDKWNTAYEWFTRTSHSLAGYHTQMSVEHMMCMSHAIECMTHHIASMHIMHDMRDVGDHMMVSSCRHVGDVRVVTPTCVSLVTRMSPHMWCASERQRCCKVCHLIVTQKCVRRCCKVWEICHYSWVLVGAIQGHLMCH